MKYEIVIEGATPPSKNQTKSWHWAKRAKVKKEWEESIGWLLKAKKVPKMQKCYMQVLISFADNKKRDEHNFLHDALADSLVKAGIIPDDCGKYLIIAMPVFVDDDKKYTKLILEELKVGGTD
ncbi:hypothetical protein [Candidatus Oleimmundimicrobium sp.]|uniref:hypothetical protein n=1 Tax=Candidatus Oleimmundimicrobium sp. TaxID=3060597 RepID=UPI002715ABD2|nr:hypothetical protein [Candidatus Oleimmundimicrobium sp.]MDO8885757.1 hypothetical protein [Candidatus Oleimmundimicrobium sp.]